MPLSVFTIESVTLILVITKDSRTIGRKTGSPFVQFISREISQATSSLTFSTRNSILETRSSRLETRYSKLSRIEYRVSRLEDRGSRDCQLTFERYCKISGGGAGSEFSGTMNYHLQICDKLSCTMNYCLKICTGLNSSWHKNAGKFPQNIVWSEISSESQEKQEFHQNWLALLFHNTVLLT